MSNLTDLIQTEANRCVKCGLCLPHCPTYQKTLHEGESPRGRIALFDGLASGKLPLSDSLLKHTNQCLSCNACEVVCPAEVKYSKLIVHGRTLIRKHKALSLLKRVINFVVLYLPKFSFFLLPVHKKMQQGQMRGNIILSPGCIHSWADRKTLLDTNYVLSALGYNVNIPENFSCCGALHAHDGQDDIAKKLQQKNITLFKKLDGTPIISTATGCTPSLQTQTNNVYDINAFLNQIDWPPTLPLNPLNKKVLLHTPCTLRNVLRQANEPLKLLQKIPCLEITTLKSKNCCGAAGTYFLEHAEMANGLASDIIDEIKNIKPDVFVTTNIGCAIHLKRQLKKNKINLEVLHPISLLKLSIVTQPNRHNTC
jgi:glycolate oxidase iron-sulfur subunit